jgi:hypothetical protein
MEVLCYLSDAIEEISCSSYLSFHDFSQRVVSHWSDAARELMDGLLVASLQRPIASLDEFLDLSTLATSIMEDDANMNYNALSGPCRVSKDSSLGVFLRYVTGVWEAMSFEESCQLYDDFKAFMMDKHIKSADLYDKKAAPESLSFLCGRGDDVLHLKPDSSLPESSKLMFYAQKAIAFNDITTGEIYLHRYYDYNGPTMFNELPIPGNNNASQASTSLQDKNIKAVISSLQTSSEDFDYNARHQNALLSLSLLWSKCRNHELSLNSLEEGLKIAHQRDDHLTVAKALLLLYQHHHTEDLLVRCLDRCVTLNHKYLATKAAILLAEHRSKRRLIPLPRDDETEVQGNSIVKHIAIDQVLAKSSPTQLWEVQDLAREEPFSPAVTWTLLLSAIYGDMKLSSIVSTHRSVPALEQSLLAVSTTSSATPALPNAAAKASGKEKAYQESCLDIDEYYEALIPVKLVAAALWQRYGLYDQAILTYTDVLNGKCTAAVPNEDLLYCCCNMVQCMMDSIDMQYLIHQNHEQSTDQLTPKLESTYLASKEILQRVKACFPATIPSVFPTTIKYTSHYIDSIYHYRSNNSISYDIAIKHVKICLDIESANNLEDEWSEDYARCMLLLARIMEHISVHDAFKMLERIERSCATKETMLMIKYQAMVLRGNIIIRHKFSLMYASKALYTEAIKASRAYNMPVVESMLSFEGRNYLSDKL